MKLKFVDIVENLQKENHGKIVIIRNGIFFIGIGKDALILNKLLGLKLTCMKPGLCKAGFLVKNVENYISKLTDAGYSFVLFLKGDSGKPEELYRYEGKDIYEEKECEDCAKCTSKKETEDEILERVKNIGKKWKKGWWTSPNS